jgi:hypothetical protein
MAHQIDAPSVAAACADIVRDPLHGGADIFRGRRPWRAGCEPIIHIDAHKAVLRRPQHDVVIERAAVRAAPVAADEAAAMDEDQHGMGARTRFRYEDIETVPFVWSVGKIAFDYNAGSRAQHDRRPNRFVMILP